MNNTLEQKTFGNFYFLNYNSNEFNNINNISTSFNISQSPVEKTCKIKPISLNKIALYNYTQSTPKTLNLLNYHLDKNINPTNFNEINSQHSSKIKHLTYKKI